MQPIDSRDEVIARRGCCAPRLLCSPAVARPGCCAPRLREATTEHLLDRNLDHDAIRALLRLPISSGVGGNRHRNRRRFAANRNRPFQTDPARPVNLTNGRPKRESGVQRFLRGAPRDDPRQTCSRVERETDRNNVQAPIGPNGRERRKMTLLEKRKCGPRK
jgi:hypothetical protein